MTDDDHQMKAAVCHNLPVLIAAAKEWQQEEELNAALSEIRAGALTVDSLNRHRLPEPVTGPDRGWIPGVLPPGFDAEATSAAPTYRCPAPAPAQPCSLRGITRDPETGTVPYCNLHRAYLENETDVAP